MDDIGLASCLAVRPTSISMRKFSQSLRARILILIAHDVEANLASFLISSRRLFHAFSVARNLTWKRLAMPSKETKTLEEPT